MLNFNIDRVAFSIFGIDIYWYAILIITGVLIGAKFAQKEFVKRGFGEDFVYDMLFVILPIAIIGARTWYVIFEWDMYKNNPIQILNFRAGGLAIHGGILFAIIGLYFYAKKKRNSPNRFTRHFGTIFSIWSSNWKMGKFCKWRSSWYANKFALGHNSRWSKSSSNIFI